MCPSGNRFRLVEISFDLEYENLKPEFLVEWNASTIFRHASLDMLCNLAYVKKCKGTTDLFTISIDFY